MGVAGQLQIHTQFLGRAKGCVGNPIGGRMAIPAVVPAEDHVCGGVKQQKIYKQTGPHRAEHVKVHRPGICLPAQQQKGGHKAKGQQNEDGIQ